MDVSTGKAPEPRVEPQDAREQSEPKRSRKPYEKPAFRCERIFETMALACGKISQTQGHCRFNRKSS